VFGEEFLTSSQRYVRNLIFGAQGNLKCTFLVLALKSECSQNSSRLEIAEYVADGVIELNLTKLNSHYVRTLFIRKMRHSVTDLAEHVFDILPEMGIVIKERELFEKVGISGRRQATGIGSRN
jgi:KaiC/GvpD/RAD55 family RecA-like ATPase